MRAHMSAYACANVRVFACIYAHFCVRHSARVAVRRYGEKGGRQRECAIPLLHGGIRRARFPHERPALIEATGRN